MPLKQEEQINIWCDGKTTRAGRPLAVRRRQLNLLGLLIAFDFRTDFQDLFFSSGNLSDDYEVSSLIGAIQGKGTQVFRDEGGAWLLSAREGIGSDSAGKKYGENSDQVHPKSIG
ncbi:MAG: hypothetical protein ACXWSZ_08305 [Bdellovibrionota bacterium]